MTKTEMLEVEILDLKNKLYAEQRYTNQLRNQIKLIMQYRDKGFNPVRIKVEETYTKSSVDGKSRDTAFNLVRKNILSKIEGKICDCITDTDLGNVCKLSIDSVMLFKSDVPNCSRGAFNDKI